MKCTGCGAEGNGKFCEYCGSALPQENMTVNITNHYYGTVVPQETVEVIEYEKPRKRRTWLWILGWLCIYPLPLTILLWRKQNMNPIVKYGVIAVAWILYFSMG